MRTKKTAFIYARVSTNKQETERQLRELIEYCDVNDLEIIDTMNEEISGTKSLKARKHLVDRVIKAKPDFFIFNDYSRLGRNLKVALEIKDQLHEHKICLISTKTGLKSLNDKGDVDITAQMVFNTLLSVHEMENEVRKQHIKSGLENAKANGKILGRPTGYRKDLVKSYPAVVRKLKDGRSIRETASITLKPKSLVQRVKKQMIELNLI